MPYHVLHPAESLNSSENMIESHTDLRVHTRASLLHCHSAWAGAKPEWGAVFTQI